MKIRSTTVALAAAVAMLAACDEGASNKTSTTSETTTTTTEAPPAAPAAQEPGNPAINDTDQNNSATPVEGANSFTEGQAKSAIEAKGYTDVGMLAKDANGIWRGMASKDGQQTEVSVDFQGNVNP